MQLQRRLVKSREHLKEQEHFQSNDYVNVGGITSYFSVASERLEMECQLLVSEQFNFKL